ncbi:unnamed protein product [Rotaria sp. Silwood1]|nr:unnamed protein product [Rotaria sp. Silwood1]CAF4865145.1 unnamed protein product [Rotaria sp. Silwood1]
MMSYPLISNLGSTSSTSAVTLAGLSTGGGNGYSELSDPYSIFVDLNGIMYILDTGNFRVVKWLPGQPLGFTVAGSGVTGTTLDKIGTSYAIYLDNQSNIYISEYGNHRITKWLNGNLTAGATTGITIAGQSGVGGSWSYQFSLPTAITFDQYNNMYIMDAGNNRIQRWWPGSTYGVTVAAASMSNPRGMAFNPSGDLVVADYSNHRMVLFPVVCPSTTTTTMAPSTNPSNQVCDTAVWSSTFRIVAGTTGSYSTALNLLNAPLDVTFDGYGYMYVVDYGNSRIQRFPPGSTSSTSAVTIAGFTSTGGAGLSEFNNPTSMFIDLNGTMYILDRDNYRVVKWLPGQPLGFTVAGGHGTGTTLDKIGESYAIYLDDQSNIYISEYGNHRITKWLNGNLAAGIRVCVSIKYELLSMLSVLVNLDRR